MAEIRKLSVEKTLNKIRADDAKQSKEAAFNDKIDVLNEEIARMRAQRLRLERHQAKYQQESQATPASPPRSTFGKLVSRLFLVFALISLCLSTGSWRRRHSPAHHRHFAFVLRVADHRGRIIRKHA